MIQSELIEAPPTGTTLEPVPVPQQALAACWGVSDRYVRMLEDKGVIERVSRNRYDLVACTTRYLRHLRDEGGRSRQVAATKEHQELKKHQAKYMRLRAEQLDRQLVDIAEVEQACMTLASTFASALDTAPLYLARDLVGLTDPQAIERKVDDALRAVRARVSEQLEALARVAVDGPAHPPSAEEDGLALGG